MGTFINFLAICMGGLIGIGLGSRLPERFQQTVLQGLSIITLVIGMQMALRSQNIVVVLFAVLIGGALGEWAGIEDGLNRLGARVEASVDRRRKLKVDPDRQSVSRGFVVAGLVFCVGPVAILGALNDGLLGDSSLLLVKSALDFFASMALAASLGIGVVLASVAVLLYQGAIAVAAHLLGGSLGSVSADTPAIIEMTATGGVLIIGLGLSLLEIKKIRVANFLPAIVLAPIFAILQGYLPFKF